MALKLKNEKYMEQLIKTVDGQELCVTCIEIVDMLDAPIFICIRFASCVQLMQTDTIYREHN